MRAGLNVQSEIRKVMLSAVFFQVATARPTSSRPYPQVNGFLSLTPYPVVVILNSLISQNITSLVTSAFNNPSTQARGSQKTATAKPLRGL